MADGEKPGAFRPSPKVDSAVLEFRRREKPIKDFATQEEFERFLSLVRACFAHRRKTLENSRTLEAGKMGWITEPSKVSLQKRLASLNIEGSRRAETLSIEEFVKLYDGLQD